MGVRESLLNTITSVADSDFVRIVTSAGASSKATVRNLFKGFESNLGAKSSLTTSDYIRVVGSDNEAYKQTLSAIMSTMGVTDLNTKMNTLITCPTITDLDTATSPNALYKFNSDASNKPPSLNSGYVFVLAEANGANTQQIVIGRGGTDAGPFWRRGRNNQGVWGSWFSEAERTLAKSYTVTVSANSYTLLENYSSLGVAKDRIRGYLYTAGNYPIILQFASEGVYLFSTVAISNKAIAIQYLYQ